jgi:hypothetical protein
MVTLLSTTVIKQFYEQKQLTLGERAVELLNVLLHGPPVGKPYYCMSGNPNNLCMSESCCYTHSAEEVLQARFFSRSHSQQMAGFLIQDLKFLTT